MACMGPDAKHARKQADKAFKEVWKLLCEKHGIEDYDKYTPREDKSVMVNGRKMTFPARGFHYKGWKKAKTELKKALRELFWEEACQSF